METEVLNRIIDSLEEVKQKISQIEGYIEELNYELKPEYVSKIKKKLKDNKGRSFDTKERFLDFLNNKL